MSVQFPGRVEALINVPSGVTASATNSGGGPTAVSLTAGSYYWTAAGTVSGLAAHIESQLNATLAPSVGAWDVSLSPTTGLIAIDCTSGAKLTKTGGVDGTNDAGANITAALTGNGFVEITVGPGTDSTRVVFGLAPSNTSAGRDSGYYFELVGAGDLWVRELGVDIGSMGTWAAGDVLRVRRTGTAITYEKNGAVLYTSLASVAGSVYGDFSLRNSASYAAGIRLYDGSAGAYSTVAWSNSTNVTATATTFSLVFPAALRDVLGFAADITSANSPQTGTLNPRGLWLPDITVNVETAPKRAPMVSDLRTTQGPTGKVYGLSGNTFLRHRSVVWPHVPIERTWESDAALDFASWEWFFKETQLGLGSSWIKVASLVQIYDHTGTLVGIDANDGAGTDGWSITGVTSIEPKPSVDGWDGRYRIEIPQLVSGG
ncbi:MAG TPA: hypothetical protein VIR54_25990 [Vicinamibacterales bacterium]